MTSVFAAAEGGGLDLGLGPVLGYSRLSGPGAGYKGSMGLGLGLVLEYRFSRKHALELDGIFVSRSMHSKDSRNAKVTMSYLDVPLLYRYWFRPFMALGVGPYLAGLLATINSEWEEGGFTSVTDQTAKKFGIKPWDAGLTVSLRGYAPVTNEIAMFADLRGSQSGFNLAERDGESARFLNISFMIGMRLIAEENQHGDPTLLERFRRKQRINELREARDQQSEERLPVVSPPPEPSPPSELSPPPAPSYFPQQYAPRRSTSPRARPRKKAPSRLEPKKKPVQRRRYQDI